MLAIPLLGEKISKAQVGALILIFGANLVVGGFGGFTFSLPELMVFAATILWAIENVIAKVALKRIDPDIVVAARMGFGSLILLSAVGLTGKAPLISGLDIRTLGLVAMTSIILFGYVSTWYRALRFAPVTLVATVLTLATIVTNTLSAIFVTHSFGFIQFAQFTFIVAGLWFFLLATRRTFSSNQLKLGLTV